MAQRYPDTRALWPQPRPLYFLEPLIEVALASLPWGNGRAPSLAHFVWRLHLLFSTLLVSDLPILNGHKNPFLSSGISTVSRSRLSRRAWDLLESTSVCLGIRLFPTTAP